MSDQASAQAIADYVAGRLEGAALEAFEERLLREPALVRELDDFAALQGALRELAAAGQLGVRSRRVPWQRYAGFAAAAALVLAVGAGMWLHGTSGRPVLYRALAEVPAGHSHTVLASLTLVTVRGGAVPAVPAAPAGLIEIAVRPAMGSNTPAVSLSLVRAAGAGRDVLGSLSQVPVDADGYAHALIDAAGMAPGRYLLVQGDPAAAPAPRDEVEFEVTHP